ncbi:hypothetical protein NP493_332g03054 [Ridgeia piscesae]|uniref:SEC63 domain-containing protein n=1 Tax=Ridgeia piscesae TaxID=27915 RepID=A0AAD9L4W5_RIDPI|nr:hypothetical protein NP493_332g03054 [Ridgeia piscesae]
MFLTPTCVGLVEVLWERQDFKALLNAVLLAKCFKAKQWESSRHMSRQLAGIGTMLSNALVNAGMVSFQKLEDTNPREIELIVNRHPPFGSQVVDAVKRLPKYELSIEQSASYAPDTAEVTVTVSLANSDLIRERSTAAPNHCCVLLVGDVGNKILYKTRLSDAMLLRTGPWSKRLDIRRAAKGEELSVNFMSQDWVGLDVQSTYTPFYSGVKRVSRGHTESAVSMGCIWTNLLVCPPVSLGSPGQSLRDNFKACNHRCLHKDTCAHECCKFGVSVKTKAPVTGMMESYRQGLKTKLDNITRTPNLKRLKQPSVQYTLQQFAYTPIMKAKMTPTVPVAPTTASGWDHLQLYEQRQQVLDMWGKQQNFYYFLNKYVHACSTDCMFAWLCKIS